jgi:acetyl esterase/lipase
LLIAAAAALTGCFPPPPGDAPLRYRDELPSAAVTVTRDVTYSTSQDGTANDLKLDVYRPTPDAVARRPLLVLVHGGAYRVGGKTAANMVTLANAFARLGYVTASINYRLLGPPEGNCGHAGVDPQVCQVAALAAQHDAQAAIRFLRANASTYGVDPDRVAITGGSAGATTALLVAVNEEDPGNSGTPGQPSTVRAAFPISGAVPPSFRPAFRAALDRTDSTVLFFYGTTDQVVPPAWVKSNAGDIDELGAGSFLQAVDGGHVPFTAADQRLYISQGS